jgi:hypothetical protein
VPIAKVEADAVTGRLRPAKGRKDGATKQKDERRMSHITFILRCFAAGDKPVSHYFACWDGK